MAAQDAARPSEKHADLVWQISVRWGLERLGPARSGFEDFGLQE